MAPNVEFIDELCDILGDNFFLCDRIDQDELFEMQDKLANLIARGANLNLGLATYMAKKFPETFYEQENE
tara:strand:+ start:260 stop:469 length:210 start_codon:yes stop_codon:yes gene_type:complete